MIDRSVGHTSILLPVQVQVQVHEEVHDEVHVRDEMEVDVHDEDGRGVLVAGAKF